jgi:hypothetical protein
MFDKIKESGAAKSVIKEMTPRVLKQKLAKSQFGRVLLHLGCLLRDSKWSWHLAGIRRELTKA